MTDTQHTDTITEMVRLTSTPSGGPRYRLTLAGGGTLTTRPDTADSYGWFPPALIGHRVTLDLDRLARVFGITPR